MNTLDCHFFNLQAQILQLHLQLVESEEKSKRTGDFDSTYKTATGTEVTVKRSPDGKFASKSNNSGSADATTTIQIDPKIARENGRVVREILTGKAGDDLKKDLATNFEHRPLIKRAIEKVDFAEVTKGDADALTNINNFMQKRFNDAVNATSQLGREITAVGVGVAAYAARALIFGAALSGALLIPTTEMLFKQGVTPKEVTKRVIAVAPEVIKDLFSPKNLGKIIKRGAVIEAVFRAIELAADALKKPKPLLIEPEADKAVREAMLGISGNALKNSLIAGVAQTPGVIEGIKTTNIEDVVKGDKDIFSNAVDFMRDKIEEAVTVVSENKEEIAIGAAIVGLGVVGLTIGIATGATTSAIVINTIGELVVGKGFGEAVRLALKKLTADQVKTIASSKLPLVIAGIVAGKGIISTIKEEVARKKIEKGGDIGAKSGGQGAKSFGKKEETVKKLVAEEGLDYEEVLQAIARRKEEPPNPKKAEKAQEQILELERESQDGAVKVAEIIRGKLGLNSIEMEEVLSIAKKEPQIRNKIIEKRGELEQAEGRGFSISRRLNELTDIEAKEGKDSPGYKWRMNIVKAEVEYGDELDGLANPSGYNKLLSAMKKPKPAPGNYETPSAIDNSAITGLFDAGGSPARTPVNLRPKILEDASNAGLELQNYLATPINAQVGLVGGMTCAFPGSNNKYSQIVKDSAELDPTFKVFTETAAFKDKNIDGLINVGDVGLDSGGQKLQGYNSLASTEEHIREMMWHESGHLLEVKLGKVAESVAFREERSQEVPSDRKVIPPQGLSAGSQDYALGEFYSPYIGLRIKGKGKYANTDRATEVLSSGMELLSSPSMAKRAAKADRETMLYALAAMNEKVKD